jgi:phosphoglycerate dehydrogenase-like enzyme
LISVLLLKEPPHQIRASEAATHRNLINTFLGLSKLASRRLNTQLRNVARRSAPYFACEHALEVADNHGDAFGYTLARWTICLYGLRSIARSLVKWLRAFDVRLLGITRDPNAAKAVTLGLDGCYGPAERDSALAQRDILVLCLRLTPETRGIIDESALASLPKRAYLINAARGALVNYGALYDSLAGRHLGGAGLDVYWTEPISPEDPLLALPNVIATRT